MGCNLVKRYICPCWRIAWKCIRYCIRVIGAGMSLLASLLICGHLYYNFFYVSQFLAQGSMTIETSIRMLTVFFGLSIFFHYYSAMWINAGRPPFDDKPGHLFGEEVTQGTGGREVVTIQLKLEIAPACYYIWCRHCKCIKPPRTHHCGVMGQCCHEYDHFCPWVCNTVGRRNYRHFFLFLLFLFVGCVLMLIMVVTCLYQRDAALRLQDSIDHIDGGSNYELLGSDTFGFASMTHATRCALCVTILAATGTSMGVLGGWHLYLILSNQTTLEFYVNMEERRFAAEEGEIFKNPFDKGWRKNVRRVFGAAPRTGAGTGACCVPPQADKHGLSLYWWARHLWPHFVEPPEPEYPLVLDKETALRFRTETACSSSSSSSGGGGV